MRYERFDTATILRLDKGDEILQCLYSVAQKEQITLATISGIGALGRTTLGVFKVGSRDYISREFVGNYELVSLSGTLTTMDDLPYLHLHAAISDTDLHMYGGHLSEGYVSATAEIVLREIDGRVERKYSRQAGLNLLDL